MITGFNSYLLLYDGYRVFTGVKRPGRGPALLLSSKTQAADVLHLYLRHPLCLHRQVTVWPLSLPLLVTIIRGSADKYLTRPTSRCRRTESIVSLERGVCSCAELQVFFLLQRLKGSMSGDARDFNNIETRAVIKVFFFSLARQAAEGNSRYSDRKIRGTWTIVCHRQKLGGPV
jgi:hypothetical protein